jgi:hypothetical protein
VGKFQRYNCDYIGGCVPTENSWNRMEEQCMMVHRASCGTEGKERGIRIVAAGKRPK